MQIQADAILQETIASIRALLGDDFGRITVERAVIGLFFTGVKLANGSTGACATPIKSIPEAVCCPTSTMAMPFPGKLRGRPAADLLDEVHQSHGIRRAVGIATMNALADAAWRRRPHPDVVLHEDLDAFDAVTIGPQEHVVVVGAFVPFLKELKRRQQPYTVLELDPATLKAEELSHFRHASEAPAVVPTGDVIMITGTTLLNDTLEGLLAAVRPEARVVVVGPTVGLVPDAYLRRGADILGSIRVTQPDAFLDLLAEGGSGYHFFGRAVQRVVLARRGLKVRAPAA